ncbi:hypothetical protein [Streptosporangium sandarakinum]|uniref:Vacuolar-type H+-ATPase subunit F/Vma7 n=1 Tax=Streptosporangium sandarakinum TaxID=1260955 RepID=A0A852V1G5_9ACTN|nr:hypothetical protein [Streptosporangium sandarakinum]NYF41094.1 vacuolar-type H+-ATPase subunit F/Vma7 [Streptosporangium sandarakinum]
MAIIGEAVRVTGYGLAGALVLPAEDPGEVRAAWRGLGPDVAVAILTPRAAAALADADGGPLRVVMPE